MVRVCLSGLQLQDYKLCKRWGTLLLLLIENVIIRTPILVHLGTPFVALLVGPLYHIFWHLLWHTVRHRVSSLWRSFWAHCGTLRHRKEQSVHSLWDSARQEVRGIIRDCIEKQEKGELSETYQVRAAGMCSSPDKLSTMWVELQMTQET